MKIVDSPHSQNGYLFLRAALKSISAGKMLPFWGRMAKICYIFTKKKAREMRDKDIVDSKERVKKERERSRKNCRIVLVRIPTYSIGLDWIHSF